MDERWQDVLENIRPLLEKLIEISRKERITEHALLYMGFAEFSSNMSSKSFCKNIPETMGGYLAIEIVLFNSGNTEVKLCIDGSITELVNCKTMNQLRRLIESLEGRAENE